MTKSILTCLVSLLNIKVTFTADEIEIVRGVARGDWDVGFSRTGVIEQATDDNGSVFDPDIFKVLNPKVHVLDDGSIFPFMHTTKVFPELPVYAAEETPDDVAAEVSRVDFVHCFNR